MSLKFWPSRPSYTDILDLYPYSFNKSCCSSRFSNMPQVRISWFESSTSTQQMYIPWQSMLQDSNRVVERTADTARKNCTTVGQHHPPTCRHWKQLTDAAFSKNMTELQGSFKMQGPAIPAKPPGVTHVFFSMPSCVQIESGTSLPPDINCWPVGSQPKAKNVPPAAKPGL